MFLNLIRHNHDQILTQKVIVQKTQALVSQQSDMNQDQQETMWNVQFPDFQFLKELEATDCSIVWLVKDLRNQQICVAKILQKFQNQSSRKNHQNCEIQFLRNYKLNLGVKIMQIQQSEDFYLILMENCCGGSLQYYIPYFTSQSKKYSKEHISWVKQCMIKIIQGLEEIHSLNFVHRDLKPSNILVSHQGFLKISDFGFIYKQNEIDSSFCGTPQYMAPEVLGNSNKKNILKAIDLWSLGVILFQLLTGNTPFQGDCKEQIIDSIYSGYINFDTQMPAAAKQLIKNLLQINVQKRMKLQQVKEHQFFKQ